MFNYHTQFYYDSLDDILAACRKAAGKEQTTTTTTSSNSKTDGTRNAVCTAETANESENIAGTQK
jgi:hypothetical protein